MFGAATSRTALRPLAGDLRQLASVRRIVLDDGPERGVRALAFSTGGGLDFWVLADRTLDLGPLWFRGIPLAWQSPSGFAAPGLVNALDDNGRGVERWFSGMLVTCGLDHIRKPEGGVLHGHLPFTPARVTAYGEDWERPAPVLFCQGEVTQSRVNGEALRLVRRIEAEIGGGRLRILDRVENLGARPQAFAMLHHVNFGFPLVQAGAHLAGHGFAHTVDPTLTGPHMLHAAAATPGWNRWTLAAPLEGRTLTATLACVGDTLPFVQIWQNLEEATRILAVEPCTSERLPDGGSGPEPVLTPGERRELRLALEFSLE